MNTTQQFETIKKTLNVNNKPLEFDRNQLFSESGYHFPKSVRKNVDPEGVVLVQIAKPTKVTNTFLKHVFNF